MTANPDIVEKIKKLLRMQRGGTDAEIDTALQLARNLAKQHGVDLTQVNADDDGSPNSVGHSTIVLKKGLCLGCMCAFPIVENYFHVEMIFGHRMNPMRLLSGPYYDRVVNIIGLPHHRAIASHVFVFLVCAFHRAWRTKRGRCRDRTSFFRGMQVGIEQNLRVSQPPEQPVQSQALVATFGAYQKKHFPNIKRGSKQRSVKNGPAAWRGYAEGKNTHIRTPVNGAAEGEGVLLGSGAASRAEMEAR